MEEINSALDSFDERTFNYDELAWNSELPSYVLLDTGYVQNQKQDWFTYGCVYYSSAEWSNYLTKKRLLAKDFIKKSTTRKEWVWDYTINWPKLLVSEWVISWYAWVFLLDSIKNSLANKRPIATGSTKINWQETKKSPFIAVIGTWYGHRFHIIGYDDKKQLLICKNSYWKETYDNWLFYIKYSDIWALHNTRVSLIENKTLIDNYKQKIMENIKLDSAKKRFELWIWNWLEWSKPISREEASSMIYRLYEKLQK